MARYPNGQIPKSELVYLGGEHWLTPATNQKWQAMRNDVFANEGVWLNITPGPNAYRDLDAQWETYRNEPPGNAAYPGTSSHGGVYEGRDSMAIDVGNWGLIGREKFYAYARKHGFEPGYFDWEPWHIIDWEPYATVAPAPIKKRRKKSDIMVEAAYTTPDGTIAVQARLGGAITLLDDRFEWGGIASATGAGAESISEETLRNLIGRYGRLPARLYDTGKFELEILAVEGDGASRYGRIGNRAWGIANTTELAALQRQGARFSTVSPKEITESLAWSNV